MLIDEAAKATYLWAECEIFKDDEFSGQIFAGRMLNISSKGGLIAYGLSADGNSFSIDGEFLGFPDPGMGLTCATYVTQVFQSFGYPIVDLASWQTREEDVNWQRSILAAIASVDPQHAVNAAKYIGSTRLRPTEAAAAITHLPPPISFSAAVELAEEIQAQISEAVLNRAH